MDKQNVVCLYNGIFNLTKGIKQWLKKKPFPKEHILYDSTDMKCSEKVKL